MFKRSRRSDTNISKVNQAKPNILSQYDAQEANVSYQTEKRLIAERRSNPKNQVASKYIQRLIKSRSHAADIHISNQMHLRQRKESNKTHNNRSLKDKLNSTNCGVAETYSQSKVILDFRNSLDTGSNDALSCS